jgi:hypothetical protein
LVATTTIPSTNLQEFVMQMPTASFSSGLAGSSVESTHWLEVFTTVAGGRSNHWEVLHSDAVISAGTKLTGDGTSGAWVSAGTVPVYFRASPTRIRRKWHFFEIDRALYAIDEREDRVAPQLYMNGDRGLASSASNSTQLAVALNIAGAYDTSGIRGQWVGGGLNPWVAIIRGTGAGQKSRINGVVGSTTIPSTWAVSPSSDSEFVIYDTNLWTELSSALVSSIGQKPVRDVAVANNVAYFAFGNTTAIGRFTWATSVHQSAKSTIANSSIADVLDTFHDPSSGETVIWRGISSAATVSRANAQDSLSSALTFDAAIRVGDTSYRFTHIEDYDGNPYIFKEDSVWALNSSDEPTKLAVGLDLFASSLNGRAVLSQGLNLYFSWSHSLERFYRSGAANEGTVDDIGPWKGSGLPAGRQGGISALAPYVAYTIAGINAGSTGVGSVQLWNGRGWHEIFRAWSTGYPVENVYLQNNAGANPRLWASVGGEIVWIRLPKDTLNPVNDPGLVSNAGTLGGMRYWPEGEIVSPTIDMGSGQLPKLFSEVDAITDNMLSCAAQEVATEYQVDENVGSTQWLSLGRFLQTPADTRKINAGDKKRIRFRFRPFTGNTGLPTITNAMVLKAVARTPVKRQWNVRAEISAFSVNAQGLPSAKPDDFYNWIQSAAESAKPLNMHAAWKAMDNVEVFAEPPVVLREFSTPDGSWGAVLQITLREI